MYKVVKCSRAAATDTVKARKMSERTFPAECEHFISEEYKKKCHSDHKREQHKADAIKEQMLDIHVSKVFLFTVFA